MGDFAIIFQIVLGIVVLFFLFVTYMNTKTWRWVHVTFMFLVFVSSIVFLVYAAQVLKTRATWVKIHDDTEKKVAESEEQVERVMRGEPNDLDGKNPSVVSVREELGRTIIDRGRVWRNCVPGQPNFQTGTIVVATSPPPDPNLPAPTVPKKNNIQPKTVLHVFRELQFQPDPTAPVIFVPGQYVGEFQATAADDRSVTLSPTMTLSPDQVRMLQTGGAPWSLYETCPVDGHDWFAGMSQQQLQAFLPQQALGLPNDQYQKLIQSYLRDGGPTEDTDPPETIYYKVKFLETYAVPVDAPILNSVDTEPFNAEGQAVLSRLRRAPFGSEPATVEFGPGPNQIPTAVLDQQTAQDLIDKKICELAEGQSKIYRRRLNDYERKFHGVYERVVELNSRLRQLDLDNKAMLASTAKANEQAKLVEELKGKIQADLEKVKFEREELAKYLQALDTRIVEVQTRLSELYRSNKAIARELAETTARLTEEIDARTKAATAMRK